MRGGEVSRGIFFIGLRKFIGYRVVFIIVDSCIFMNFVGVVIFRRGIDL